MISESSGGVVNDIEGSRATKLCRNCDQHQKLMYHVTLQIGRIGLNGMTSHGTVGGIQGGPDGMRAGARALSQNIHAYLAASGVDGVKVDAQVLARLWETIFMLAAAASQIFVRTDDFLYRWLDVCVRAHDRCSLITLGRIEHHLASDYYFANWCGPCHCRKIISHAS